MACSHRAAHRSAPKCGLTLRSSGPPPAWHLGREPFQVIIRLAAQAPTRRGPLSSNVRQTQNTQMIGTPSARRTTARPPNTAAFQQRFPVIDWRQSQGYEARRQTQALQPSGRFHHAGVGRFDSKRSRISVVAPAMPNPSLERTSTGMALGPRRSSGHHPLRGPSTTPVVSAQLKR